MFLFSLQIQLPSLSSVNLLPLSLHILFSARQTPDSFSPCSFAPGPLYFFTTSHPAQQFNLHLQPYSQLIQLTTMEVTRRNDNKKKLQKLLTNEQCKKPREKWKGSFWINNKIRFDLTASALFHKQWNNHVINIFNIYFMSIIYVIYRITTQACRKRPPHSSAISVLILHL